MPLKKLKLNVPSAKRPIDPLGVFKGLTLRGTIENIWEPQAEALREWHGRRSEPDIVIQMNTGGGKTLVGLLAAQSLVNESRGHVLYVCPTNQLVEQTALRAKEIGLTPAVRSGGDWTNRDGYESGEVFCLTNYATLFNGRSIFRTGEIDGIIFDDAHVAENAIRGQFTLRISPTHKAFEAVLGLCRKHFGGSGQSSRFKDVMDGRPTAVLFLPAFVVWQHATEFRKILIEAGVEEEDETKFAWEHLKDHLDRCCMLVDSRGLEIAPPLLPLAHLAYFNENVRRVYLTATLPSQASFTRAFGVAKPALIEPSGKSGEAQRLFVIVPGNGDGAQRTKAIALVANRKCCVISSSHSMAAEWVPPASIFDTSAGQAEIDRFKRSPDAEMLALVARYDGIDLPGDACRILILDRLLAGENLIDRFIDESIRVETIRTSHAATRIVQAIGRIFRSNTDHGVVLLVGERLQSWLRTPKNQSYLPKLLQQQLQLSAELNKQVDSRQTTWTELIDALLDGDPTWDEMYDEYISQFQAGATDPTAEWHIDLILRERDAYELLWQGQYHRASLVYDEIAEAAQKRDGRLAAWYQHWGGLALLCADDRQEAYQRFVSAANVRSELGRPRWKQETLFHPARPSAVSPQAQRLAAQYRTRKGKAWAALERARTDLVLGPETAKAEEAMKLLGEMLGLSAERPDKGIGTGPDVVWTGEGSIAAWGFELKTNKDADGEYSKGDISQCHDHEEWLRKAHGDGARLAIVGPLLPVSARSNPSESLRIIEVGTLQELRERCKEMFDAVESGDPTNLEESFQTWLAHNGLLWPGCVDALDSRLAVDLRK